MKISLNPHFKKNALVSEISDLFKKILNYEEAKELYISKFNRCNKSIEQNKEILKIHHFTVLVIEKSGCGKTFIIDNILKLGPKTNESNANKKNIKEMVEGGFERIGEIATKANHAYKSHKVVGIRIIDTSGSDLDKNDVNTTIYQSKKEINKQENSKDQCDL